MARRGAGRPPAAELEAHKEAILAAATQVLLEFGFTKASTAEIARRAGASKKTLYSLYPRKAALYAALMQRRVEDVLRPITKNGFHYERPVEETLSLHGRRVIQLVTGEEGQRLYRMIVAEGADFLELGSAYWNNGPARGQVFLKDCFDHLVSLGTLAIENTDYAALQFIGMLVGIPLLRSSLRQASLFHDEQAVSDWLRRAVETFLRAHGKPSRKKTAR